MNHNIDIILWKIAGIIILSVIVITLSIGYLKVGFDLFDGFVTLCLYLLYRAYFVQAYNNQN